MVLAISALGILGGGIAYILYTGIIRTWGPARASTVTYLAPHVVGVTFGALFLGETVHWNEPVGGAIVVLGILASQAGLRCAGQPPIPHLSPSPPPSAALPR